MEKELRNSYYVSLVIVTLLLYFLLKKEGGMAMGVLLIFCITCIPFFIINIGRTFSKIKKVTSCLNIIYLLTITVYSIIYLKTEGIILALICILIILLVIFELYKKKNIIISNLLGFLHLIIFITYVIW
jgi:hypothetical protein